MGPDTGGERLPPLYERWVTDLLGGAIPRETLATCEQCAMCPPPGEEPGGVTFHFDAAVKCCTYVPNLYNFLVGRILADTDPAARTGRATVEKRIAERLAVTPLGLRQTPVFALLYENSDRFFGRTRALHCPHQLEDGGRCGIWRHRNSTCATWFCKHARGKLGYTFWREALHRLLLSVEQDLVRWCVLELQSDGEALRHLLDRPEWGFSTSSVTGESLDNRVNHEAYARVWGIWHGREHEFFVRCAELVNALSWNGVLGICGPEARACAQLAQHAYGRLVSDAIPATLRAGAFELVHVRDGVARLNTYDCYDPIDVPRAVMDLLYYFDGRPTAEALAAIARERGFRLEPDLVRKLMDFGLLVSEK